MRSAFPVPVPQPALLSVKKTPALLSQDPVAPPFLFLCPTESSDRASSSSRSVPHLPGPSTFLSRFWSLSSVPHVEIPSPKPAGRTWSLFSAWFSCIPTTCFSWRYSTLFLLDLSISYVPVGFPWPSDVQGVSLSGSRASLPSPCVFVWDPWPSPTVPVQNIQAAWIFQTWQWRSPSLLVPVHLLS